MAKPASVVVEHTTIALRMRGETVQVDELMLPLVVWLNRLRGVRTYACCEGWDSLKGERSPHGLLSQPYVAFTCTSMKSVETIFATLTKRIPRPRGSGPCFKIYAHGEISRYPVASRNSCSFCLRFISKKHLRDYLRRVNRLLREEATV